MILGPYLFFFIFFFIQQGWEGSAITAIPDIYCMRYHIGTTITLIEKK